MRKCCVGVYMCTRVNDSSYSLPSKDASTRGVGVNVANAIKQPSTLFDLIKFRAIEQRKALPSCSQTFPRTDGTARNSNRDECDADVQRRQLCRVQNRSTPKLPKHSPERDALPRWDLISSPPVLSSHRSRLRTLIMAWSKTNLPFSVKRLNENEVVYDAHDYEGIPL